MSGRVGEGQLDSFIDVEGIFVIDIERDNVADHTGRTIDRPHFRTGYVQLQAKLGITQADDPTEVFLLPWDGFDVARLLTGYRANPDSGYQREAGRDGQPSLLNLPVTHTWHRRVMPYPSQIVPRSIFDRRSHVSP